MRKIVSTFLALLTLFLTATNPSNGTLVVQSSDPGICQMRCTLVSGSPVADASSGSTIYGDPYNGYMIALADSNGVFTARNLTSEIGCALSGLTTGSTYDLYVYWNGSSVAFDTPVAWSNSTTPPSRQTINGVICKGSDATRRLVAIFEAASATTTCNSPSERWLGNMQNRVKESLLATGLAGSSWSYAGGSWRASDANTTDGSGRVSFVVPTANQMVDATVFEAMGSNSSAFDAYNGLAVDSTSSPAVNGVIYLQNGYGQPPASIRYSTEVAQGFHYMQSLEATNGVTSVFEQLNMAGAIDE